MTSRFFYALDTYGIPFTSTRAPSKQDGIQWLKHAIQKPCVNNALLSLAVVLAAAKELHNCSEIEENAHNLLLLETAENGGGGAGKKTESPTLINPCYRILEKAMGAFLFFPFFCSVPRREGVSSLGTVSYSIDSF